MTFDIPAFRTNFPEFSNTEKYPTAQITFWANFAAAMVRECVWKTQWSVGVSLYVAHEITLAALNDQIASNGGQPGSGGGIANSKTVGNASIGYDTAGVVEKDAGYFNTTLYGRQFYRLSQLFGMGAIQL